MLKKIDCIIIGAKKAGTTSLKNYLMQHPDIISHNTMEFNFFLWDYEFEKTYEKMFNHYFNVSNNENSKKTILAKSATLYCNEKAIKRIHNHNPDCKLIFVLRNPTDRVYSDFCFNKKNGRAGNENINELIVDIKSKNYKTQMFTRYVCIGLYVKYLITIYKYFPRENVLLIKFEDLVSNSAKVLDMVFHFLELETVDNINYNKIHNKTTVPKYPIIAKFHNNLRNRSNIIRRFLPFRLYKCISAFLSDFNRSKKKFNDLDRKHRKILLNYYRPYNKELEKMTGIDFSHWEI